MTGKLKDLALPELAGVSAWATDPALRRLASSVMTGKLGRAILPTRKNVQCLARSLSETDAVLLAENVEAFGSIDTFDVFKDRHNEIFADPTSWLRRY